MLSSNRIIKSAYVTIDTENKVIEVDSLDADLEAPAAADDPNKILKDAKRAAAKMIKQAELQAEEIVNNAVAEAEQKRTQIIQAAEDEAIEIKADAKENGYSEGISSASAKAGQIEADATKILQDALAEQQAKRDELEPDIVNMIISIVEKLLGNIPDLNPSLVLNLVKQGFASSSISGDVKVHVSPDDYTAVVSKKDEILSLTDGTVNLEIVKDLSLTPLDCLIETPFGMIDCSLGQQYEALRANLIYILNNK